jgi:1-phosphofructokinase family hexose kinase
MFLTVTPNLCIERTLEIPEFAAGHVHRVAPESLLVNAGGKGINAARVAGNMGAKVLALTWVGRLQRAWFEEQLAREGVPHELIEVEADTRICTNILHGDGRKTELVEAGAPLRSEAGEQMLQRFDAVLPQCELAAVCGSYPQSTSSAIDSHLTKMSALAKKHNKKLLVDGKGPSFELLLKSKHAPWAIKPNTDEAAAFLKRPIQNEIDERSAVEALLDCGVEVVLLSCGARGAWLGTWKQKYFFPPPIVQEVSAVGSGDSFVGAFAARYLETHDLVEATRWGCAAGAASASQKMSAFCTRAEVEALLPQVEIATG